VPLLELIGRGDAGVGNGSIENNAPRGRRPACSVSFYGDTIRCRSRANEISGMGKFARHLGLFAILIALVTVSAAPGSAQPSAFESFRNALVDYFARMNYVPVLVNRGYTVGDVVELMG
jgi:hypothetical protein